MITTLEQLEKLALSPMGIKMLAGGGLGALSGAAGGAAASAPGQRRTGAIKGALGGAAMGTAAGAGAGAIGRLAKAAPAQAARAAKAAPRSLVKAPTMAPSSVGGDVISRAAKTNPTLNAVESTGRVYEQLNPNLRRMIEDSDAVKKWGVQPQAALDILYKGRKKGEDLSSVISRQILQPAGGAGQAAARGSATAATNVGRIASPTAATNVAAVGARDLPTIAPGMRKAAFATSGFSGELGPGPALPYVSGMPGFRVQPFKKPGAKEKTAGLAQTPAGRLSLSSNVGAPKISPPAGPSIADISKPRGFGKPMPGAVKTAQAARREALIEQLMQY